MKTVLIAEDEPEVRSYLGFALKCEGYKVEFAEDGFEAISLLERERSRFSVLLLDLVMPRKDGFATLKEVRKTWPRLPVITISGLCTPANIASVMKDGAADFLAKPIGHGELLRAVEAALDGSCIDTLAEAGLTASHVRTPDCTWSEAIEPLLCRLGNSDVPVLLRGETGVGKEVLARKVHEQSKRAGQPFLKLNCAALPSELVESELFGYERGAFTGAFKTTPGKFELANNGTILLDEIGDMDFKLQAKLLQVLQDHEFLRLGAKNSSQVDVRVMAATHCNLEEAIQAGRFREDLYYRLNIVEIHVPPLRERKDEIIGLAEYFLRKHSPAEPILLPQRLREALMKYDWPGNVRQLENVMRRLIVFRNADLISIELTKKAQLTVAVSLPDSRMQSSENMRTEPPRLPITMLLANPESRSETQAPDRSLENGTSGHPAQQQATFQQARPMHSAAPGNIPLQEATRRSILDQVDEARRAAEAKAILAALNSTLWNRKEAAKALQIDYKALLYKMKKLNIGTK